MKKTFSDVKLEVRQVIGGTVASPTPPSFPPSSPGVTPPASPSTPEGTPEPPLALTNNGRKRKATAKEAIVAQTGKPINATLTAEEATSVLFPNSLIINLDSPGLELGKLSGPLTLQQFKAAIDKAIANGGLTSENREENPDETLVCSYLDPATEAIFEEPGMQYSINGFSFAYYKKEKILRPNLNPMDF